MQLTERADPVVHILLLKCSIDTLVSCLLFADGLVSIAIAAVRQKEINLFDQMV